MATTRIALGICDTCGFEYPYRELKRNSYGMMVCPEDYEDQYDLKNHPQNRSPNVRDDEYIRNPRPPLNNDRNIVWNNASIDWEDETQYWNLV